MATLTNKNVTITVSVLYGLIPLIWLLLYLVDGFRHGKFGRDKSEINPSLEGVNYNAEPFLTSHFVKIAYLFTFALFIAASVLMIIYSIDDGVSVNRS